MYGLTSSILAGDTYRAFELAPKVLAGIVNINSPTVNDEIHLPDFFWRETNDSAHPVGGIVPPAWDEASALAFMDDAGIDVAVTSISTPGVHVGDDARASAGAALQRTLCKPDPAVAGPVWRLRRAAATRCGRRARRAGLCR